MSQEKMFNRLGVNNKLRAISIDFTNTRNTSAKQMQSTESQSKNK